MGRCLKAMVVVVVKSIACPQVLVQRGRLFVGHLGEMVSVAGTGKRARVSFGSTGVLARPLAHWP